MVCQTADQGARKVMTPPLISICLPTHMREGFRIELLARSLSSALRQTYHSLEIVVFNNGADEEIREYVRRIQDSRLRYLEAPGFLDYGPSWNTAVRGSHGTYFLLHSDDDWLEDDAISILARFLDCHPNVGFVYGDFDLVDRDSDRVLSRWRNHRGQFIHQGFRAFPWYIRGTRGCLEATLWRRDIFDQVGGFDDAGSPSDNSLYLKYLMVSDVGHVDHKVCNYSIRVSMPDGETCQLRRIEEDARLVDRYVNDWPPQILKQRDRTVAQARRHLARKALFLAAKSHTSEVKHQAETLAKVLDAGILSCVYRLFLVCGGRPVIEASLWLDQAMRGIIRRFLYWFNHRTSNG